MGDAKTIALKENLQTALLAYPIKADIKEVSEVNLVFTSGVHETPALVIDGYIACEGHVPSAKEIELLLRNRLLLKSKLVQIRHILVPVDFEKASKSAFLYACNLAATFNATIEILYAYEGIFDGGRASTSGIIDSIRKSMEGELKDFVEDMSAKLPPHVLKNCSFKTSVYAGYPEAGIIEHSDKSDLIVMGSTAKNELPSWIFGSTGAAVMKAAHCPVLLIRENTVFTGLKNVVYASHYESLHSLKIKEAIRFTEKFDGQVHFVHVGPEGEKGVEFEQKLLEIQHSFSDSHKPFLFERLLGDNIPELLNQYAVDHKIDLVIFVTEHRSFWKDLWHKSATKNMLFHSDIPLLVLSLDNPNTHTH